MQARGGANVRIFPSRFDLNSWNPSREEVFKSPPERLLLILLSLVMLVSSGWSCRASLSAVFVQKRSEVFLGSVLTGGGGRGRGGGEGGGGNQAMSCNSIYVICPSCCQIFSQSLSLKRTRALKGREHLGLVLGRILNMAYSRWKKTWLKF